MRSRAIGGKSACARCQGSRAVAPAARPALIRSRRPVSRIAGRSDMSRVSPVGLAHAARGCGIPRRRNPAVKQAAARPGGAGNWRQTTRCSNASPVRSRRQFSAITTRLRSSVSTVSQARCGVTTTFGSFKSGSSAPTGSRQNTSRPAAPSCPFVSASSKAFSSTRCPRAVLIRMLPRFIPARAAEPMIRAVSAARGRCSESTSASGSISENRTKRIGESAAACRLV